MRYIRQALSLITILSTAAIIAGCSGKSGGGKESANCSLSNITLSDGISLSPAFSGGTTSYTATAPATLEDCSVTIYAGHSEQEIECGGNTVSAGKSFSVNLSESENLISIKVTAQNGTENIYLLNIRKTSTPSSNASLSNITVSSTEAEILSPSFNSDTLSYDVYIENMKSSVTITATSVEADERITIDGNSVDSGKSSPAIGVEANSSVTVPIHVTAADGLATKDYSVTIHRAGALSNNSYLSSLDLSSSKSWDKTFAKNINSYAITVANSASSVTITPTVEDTGKATVSVNGIALPSGTASAQIALTENVTRQIPVVVTAQDGTQRTYSLNITREGALSENAYLSSLSTGTVSLSPAFVKTTNNYTATVDSSAESITIVTSTEDVDSTIKINGESYTKGSSKVIEIANGTTEIAIEVSAPSGKLNTYIISVTKTSSLVIYFEKPSAWSEAWIWYDNDPSTTAWNTTVLRTAPGDMTFHRTVNNLTWYKKDLAGSSSVTFLFNDGTWNNKLQNAGKDFTATRSVWVRADGSFTTYDPITPQPPVITVNPTGGEFDSSSFNVSISISSGETVTEKSYTITVNNGVPVTSAMSSNTATVNIASGTSIGDVVKLQVTALNASGRTTTNQYEYTRVEKVATGLGARYSSSSTTFAIWSPGSSDVKVNLAGTDYTCGKIADFDGYTDIYSVTVAGDHKLKEYSFKIGGVSVCDPNGVMIKPGTTKNIVMDLSSTDPDGGWVDRPALAEREDSVIYEVHIRDFSIDSSSGVDSAKRGKYLGMVQSGTTCTSGGTTVKTGIDHLADLGVTHVQIMPMYDFATSLYNWGYDPLNFNVPEEQYASDGADYTARIKEVKTMINELHKKGIRVIMDVVYNHTFDGSPFNAITSRYYYTDERKDFAGCGVALNCSEPMVSRFIQDSMNYWVSEFHVDGFRMDLAGIFYYSCVNDWADSLNQNNPGENILVYGEPWDGYYYDDPTRYHPDAQHSMRVRMRTAPAMGNHHVGVFSGQFREYIKGDNDGTGKGYMFNGSDKDWKSWDAIPAGARGSITAVKSTNPLSADYDPMFAYDPEQSINYISAHDNFCLWDKIKYSGYDSAYGKRIDKFGMGIVLTSQGIPFMHGGDEMLRTKAYNGDYATAKNSYNASDNYNKFDWTWKASNNAVYEYYKNMIAIRKAHPGFRMNSWDEVNGNVACTTANGRQVVITTINSSANSDTWSRIMVIYNSGSDYTLSLSGTWKIAVQDENAAVGGTPVSGSVICKGTAVTILYQ